MGDFEQDLGGYNASAKLIERKRADGVMEKLISKEPFIDPNFEGECVPGENPEQPKWFRILKRWEFFKKLGIPVVDKMSSEFGKILETDMTADGSIIIDKHWHDKLLTDLAVKNERRISPLEERFVKIDRKKIKEKILRNHKLAWDAGYVLPTDDEEYSVLVKPDGDFEVFVKDFSYVRRIRNEPWMHDGNGEMQLADNFDEITKKMNDTLWEWTKESIKLKYRK